ncbi:11806_t:CDS:10 [Ambispora leptoticha]|uniref:1-phosphatidylinositol-4-phosphate 5-kinase n=1 Tax=Ambispora leptoticha TaxID=144679 RepID=A0A9N8VWH5_9GLOM|nr:11806_t:CDS:10 [Ambispora leptoticha]
MLSSASVVSEHKTAQKLSKLGAGTDSAVDKKAEKQQTIERRHSPTIKMTTSLAGMQSSSSLGNMIDSDPKNNNISTSTTIINQSIIGVNGQTNQQPPQQIINASTIINTSNEVITTEVFQTVDDFGKTAASITTRTITAIPTYKRRSDISNNINTTSQEKLPIQQQPPLPDNDKKSVSFPANIVIKDVAVEIDRQVTDNNIMNGSPNSPTASNYSQDSIKTSPIRSYTEPSKRRPSSLSAIQEPATQIPPQRSATTAGKSKKISDLDGQTEGGKKRSLRIRRRNTYSADLTHSRELDEEAHKSPDALRKRRLTKKRNREKDDEEEPVIGTRIGEDHVNYVLMYNMLTGIRVGVSRCSAKFPRDLTDADFKAAHKLAFDITGNELTPSAKYDFKFKDYAPWVFRHLRDQFHIDPADYLVSLTSKYILSELNSPGKSGSFFYFSRDYRFIIKTIHHTEHKFLRKILKEYYEHIKANPNTLLSRFYGLHRVKLPRGSKIHFVVMNNIFPPHRDIHEIYDLKGSTVGREYTKADEQSKGAVLKDLNWTKRNRRLELGPVKRKLFVEQLEKDVELLKRLNIMDYSLLVGLHDMSRGNKDNIREGILTVFEPDTKKLERAPSHHKRESKLSALRKAVVTTDPLNLGPSTKLTLDTFTDRQRQRHCVFYTDDGGFAATDESNRSTNYIYYLGVIDILTPYNATKKIEHAWKSLSHDKHEISAVNPIFYGERFLDFMVKTIKHNDVRPQEETSESNTVPEPIASN